MNPYSSSSKPHSVSVSQSPRSDVNFPSKTSKQTNGTHPPFRLNTDNATKNGNEQLHTTNRSATGRKVLTREEIGEKIKTLTSLHTMTTPGAIKDKTRIIEELGEVARFLQIEVAHSTDIITQLNESLARVTGENKELTERLRRQQQALQVHETRAHNVSASIESTAEMIRAVEADIRRYDVSGGATLQRPRQIVAETEEGKLALLHELYVKRVEDLVMTLKKKVAKYEESESLANVVVEHGDVATLLEENARLKRENEFLKLREMKFSTSSLLKRRRLMDCEPAFLRLLIVGLQNELASARRLIDKYGYERNPTLKLLVAPPVPPVDPTSLEDIERTYTEHEWQALREQFAPGDPENPRFGIVPSEDPEGETMASLRQRNALLEASMINLVAQVKEYELQQQREKEIDKDRDEILSELMHGSTKAVEKRIIELQLKNERIVSSENELLLALSKKDQTIIYQEERMAESLKEREMLHQENAALSGKLLELSKLNMDAVSQMTHLKKQLKALHLVSLTMCETLIERLDVPIRAKSAIVGYMFRDVFETYVRSVAAAVRIQACFRGAIARRRQGVARENIRYIQLAFGGREAIDRAEERRRQRELERAQRHPLADAGSDAEGDSEDEFNEDEEWDPPMVLTLKGLPQPDGSLALPNRIFAFTYFRQKTPRSLGVNGPSIVIPGEPLDTPRELTKKQPDPSSLIQTGKIIIPGQKSSSGKNIDPADQDPEGPVFAGETPLASSLEQREFFLRLIESTGHAEDYLDYGCAFSSIAPTGPTKRANDAASGARKTAEQQPRFVTRSGLLDVLWKKLEEAQSLAPVPQPVPIDPYETRKEKTFLPAFSALSAIVATVETDFSRNLRPAQILDIARREVLQSLKPRIEGEFVRMANEMQDKVAAILRANGAVLNKPTVSRSTQVKPPEASSSAQTETETDEAQKTARGGKPGAAGALASKKK